MLSILKLFYLNPVMSQSYQDDPNEGLATGMTNFIRALKNLPQENMVKILSKMN